MTQEQSQTSAPGSAAVDVLLRDYLRQPGVADELFDPGGQIRPVWSAFLTELARLDPSDVDRSFARADQYLRDAGVFFRHYSSDPLQERAWPLSHVPVILAAHEWDTICSGLQQRADLLERVAADLYGAGELVRKGHLPARLIAGNPQWLRPMVGVQPASGHFLHSMAFEIGRGPDGRWFVLSDRAQAPSGAGFALENRMATTRIFPQPFPRARVQRLAGFFRAFRETMERLPDMSGRLSAILTPGPSTDTYFEHMYIARYLGLMLLEGDDLLVDDGEVKVRTVEGLKPIGVLWRRLDADFADPMELNEYSQIGTPGLVEALRSGYPHMINALGVGVLETRAMMAFLPKISEILTGETLRLPNIATWWCGQRAERDYVKKNVDRMVISDTLSCALPFNIPDTDAGVSMRPGARQDRCLADRIDADGPALVGQEAVTLSTTPVWFNGRLVPRPMTVRVFAARTPEGWTFMPGGYARIGREGEATSLAMQDGGAVADVWIMNEARAPRDTLFGSGRTFREEPGFLPSRAADNLFWLGRYIERTESTIRLLRAYHHRFAEAGNPDEPLLRDLQAYLSGVGTDVTVPVPQALNDLLMAAQTCAGRVRDRFSTDGWAALQDLAATQTSMTGITEPGDEAARAMRVLLRKITAFSGLVHENMYRFTGWRFLSLGRALERSDAMAAALAQFADRSAPIGALDLMVEYGDSVMTHQRRYRIETGRQSVVDLLALDHDNPRAILFQLRAMCTMAEALPGAVDEGQVSDVLRMLLPLETELAVAHPDEMTTRRLTSLRSQLAEVSRVVSSRYLI